MGGVVVVDYGVQDMSSQLQDKHEDHAVKMLGGRSCSQFTWIKTSAL